jgi:hypothetical protein
VERAPPAVSSSAPRNAHAWTSSSASARAREDGQEGEGAREA